MSKCCFQGFQWERTPTGRVGKLANNDTYIAIRFVADIFGRDFYNSCLLADHFVREIGAVGYCYGRWAAFRLGAKEHSSSPLVDCISLSHPPLLTKQDIEEIAVLVQVLAPEIDRAYTVELKQHTWETI